MPGPLYHVGATGICMHGGQVSTVSANARVLVSGQPVAVLSDMSTIAGCPFQIPVGPGTKPQPCMTVRWLVPATRVLVGGQPALLQTSTGLCLSAEQIPQGAPTITVNQARVIAT
ncbi:MAG: PAAR-like protein [Aquincola tertiaricarbonis]|uniref:PAAR-like protein n=1 Tax=Aquincola TaxID=391952 RepID=UPI00061523D0|nr:MULTISPECIES: PAAR-like protein [Aquincola]MCR5868343.1 hypothetical protein [Aquincola sp. J276]